MLPELNQPCESTEVGGNPKPSTRIHDLRHSAASIAIARGANVKEVQQMLGHASATVTLDTYSHVFPSLAEQLRDRMDSAYEEARSDASSASG